MDNIVFIFGERHHNGLALARMLGCNGVTVYSVILSDKRKGFMEMSRYIKKYFVFSNAGEALDFLKGYRSRLKQMPFIFAYSDAAVLELDKRLDEFRDLYFIPSIDGKQGKIAEWMDKQKQFEFAEKYGLDMAKTATSDLSALENVSISFPWILKPVISAEGSKKDIIIVNSYQELETKKKELENKGYQKILVQPYLNIDQEIVIVGAIYKNRNESSAFLYEVIRRWPDKSGTNSYSAAVTDTELIRKCQNILECIKKEKFSGLIDVEVFIVNGRLYLNEINWRNSGGGFRGLSSGCHYAYWWYRDALGMDIGDSFLQTPGHAYSMVEYTDIRHVIRRKVSILRWLREYAKTSDFALKYKHDMLPCIGKYFFYFLERRNKK